MNADQVLRLLGKYNRWQIQNYLVLAFGFAVPFAWMLMSIVFIGDTPNYRCALPSNATFNDTIPLVQKDDGSWVYDKCTMYANISVDNSTVPCQYGYWYDPDSGYDSTLTSEWDLVCGQEWLVELSMGISAAGAIIGSIIFNLLADKYGRKKVFLFCIWSNSVIALAMAFSPNITFFIVLGFLDGLQQQGMVAASFILAVELFPTNQRTFAGNAIEFFWSFGYMSLVLIAYFVRNWRHLMVIISAPLFVSFGFYWLITESVPWLVTNGKIKQADQVMRNAAKKCKVELPDRLFDDQVSETEMTLFAVHQDGIGGDSNASDCELENSGVPNKNNVGTVSEKKQFSYSSLSSPVDNSSENKERENEHLTRELENSENAAPEVEFVNSSDFDDVGGAPDGENKKYDIMDILHSSYIRRYTLVFVCVWFVNSFAYGAINLTVTYLPGDRYLNTFLYAVLEIPAYAITWILSAKVGRKLPLIMFNVVGGLALSSTIIQTFDFESDITWVIIMFSMIGKTAITASFALIYVIAPELFPTNYRNMGLGMCQVFARIAQLIAPFARTLHRSMPWLSPLLVGILSIVVGLMSFVIPETKHHKLPDTIEEIEAWKTSKNKS